MASHQRITAEQIRRASRDQLMLRVIQGTTKASVHVDRRKEESRNACRDGAWRRGV
jgi:hypothetical protein